jgi:prepilin-type N-terminal cleavage/methylation domain-containing protein
MNQLRPSNIEEHETLTRYITIILGLFFLLTAAAKAIEVHLFSIHVARVAPFLQSTSLYVASGVILFEATLGWSLLTASRPRGAGIVALMAILIFSAVTAIGMARGLEGGCGCFGSSRLDKLDDPRVSLGLNACIVVACLGLIRRDSSGSVRVPVSRRGDGTGPHSRRAFTLIETLVVILIIALLVALAAPALRSARNQTDAVMSLATMRELGMSIQSYTYDHNLSFPYLGTPGDPNSPTSINGVDISDAQGGYFRRLSTFWPSAALPFIKGRPTIGGIPCLVDWVDDGVAYPEVVHTRYRMTHTAFAAPEYWDPAVPSPETGLLRGTKSTEVLHPARKGLLLDIASPAFVEVAADGASASDKVLIQFVDGSAKSLPWYPQAEYVSRRLGASPFPIMSTAHGLRGIDY